MRRFLLTLYLAIAAIFPAAANAQTAPVGVVQGVEGGARATRQNADAPLHVGDPVFSNDLLSTDAGARLAVSFTDGTKLALGPEAEITIDDFVYNPNAGPNILALRLLAGAARFVSGQIERESQKTIKVTTPVATIGIRGTDFFIELQERHLAAALFSGFEISVANPSGETVLRPGEGTDVWDTSAPSHRQPWSTLRINRALALVTLESPLQYNRPIAVADSLGAALTDGKYSIDVRYRYEAVDQSGKTLGAYSNSVRLRLGYETLAWNGFFTGIEGEVVRDIGRVQRSDGVTTLPNVPLIADPKTERLEQAYVGWSTAGSDPQASTRVVVGRLRFAYDDERWIGSSDFRQTDQTFDAATFETRAIPGFDLRYAYIDQVNRILGDNPGGTWGSDSHLIGASTTLVPFGVTTAYAYLLDLYPAPSLSSATTGLRYDGHIESGVLKYGLEAEAARQTGYAANPNQFSLIYGLLRPSLEWNGTTLFASWEVLSGNGREALQTPLATYHAQNGWAEVFNTTPLNGLRDFRLRWLQELPDLGPLKNIKLDARLDDFAATHIDEHYGREYDADINGSFRGWATVGVQFARYTAMGFGSDTTKLWAYLSVQY